MNTPSQSPPTDVASPPTPDVRRQRVGLGVLLLTVLTLGAMALTLFRPERTVMHFWLIAQLVPVLYWLLLWALVSWPARGGDVD